MQVQTGGSFYVFWDTLLVCTTKVMLRTHAGDYKSQRSHNNIRTASSLGTRLPSQRGEGPRLFSHSSIATRVISRITDSQLA